MAMPTMSVYSASKFALEGATESLCYELRPFGIHVTLIQPGFINSESFRRTRLTEGGEQALADSESPYHQHYLQMSRFVAGLMGRTRSRSQSVARRILKTICRRKPPLRVSGTLDASLFTLLRRLLPRRLYHALLYRSLPGVQSWGTVLEIDDQVESHALEGGHVAAGSGHADTAASESPGKESHDSTLG